VWHAPDADGAARAEDDGMVDFRDGRVRRGLAAIGRIVWAGIRALAGPPDPGRVLPGEELADCLKCGSSFVCPVEWDTAGEAAWWLRLRCGACEATRELVIGDAAATGFDRTLGRQAAMIERAIAQLDRERMIEEVDAFVSALQAGRVDASAFGA
jgi:hypothetical protein